MILKQLKLFSNSQLYTLSLFVISLNINLTIKIKQNKTITKEVTVT